MKNLKSIFSSLVVVLLLYGCDQGIDPITFVDPGPDAESPQVTISSPGDGAAIFSNKQFVSTTISFKVTDDIELASVTADFDGTQLTNITNFVDYRTVNIEGLVYDKISDGDHTITVKATDINGNITVESVNITKGPGYIPVYGEIFYMPFNGTFTELISENDPITVGSPGYNAEGIASQAYKGAPNSYLTFPATGLLGQEFSASFWINLNATPNRAGILTISPEDTENPDEPNNRSTGIRLFREDVGGNQVVKLNIGTGTDNWFDGGATAALPPGEWAHVAISIGQMEAAVYVNGTVVSEGSFPGLNWTGCDLISIASGAPRFVQWGHLSEESSIDELRLFDKAITSAEIDAIRNAGPAFPEPSFQMNFEGNYANEKGMDPTVVGTPAAFATGYNSPNAYQGAPAAYLTAPTTGLLGAEISAMFWINLNATPNRAAILTIGPEDTVNPDNQNNRSSGIRLFREDVGGNQVVKLNIGTGTDNWFDGGATATIPPGEWAHVAISIGETEATVYVNGEVVSQGEFPGLDWTGCDLLSIGSGAPRFVEWGHLAEESPLDDFRIYSQALTQSQIQTILSE